MFNRVLALWQGLLHWSKVYKAVPRWGTCNGSTEAFQENKDCEEMGQEETNLHAIIQLLYFSAHLWPMKHSETVKENQTLLHSAWWGWRTINFFKAHSRDLCCSSEETANLQVNQNNDEIKQWHKNSSWPFFFFFNVPLKHRYTVMKRMLLFLQRKALKV